MIRLGALFVAICMVVIAGSFGALLYLVFGVTGAESAVVALAALTGLATYNAVTTRIRVQAELSAQIGDLSRGVADLARQVGEQGRRIAALEKGSDAAVQRALAVTQPVQAEIAELGTLFKQLAETVAAQETAIRGLSGHAPAPLPRDLAPPLAAEGPAAREAAAPAPFVTPRAASGGPLRGMTGAAVAETVRAALADNRIDVYLQPIVTLPQRKVRSYEALMRLRLPDGAVAEAADFLAAAESDGLMPQLDYLVLTRCVRVLRRLQAKSRDVGVFCNLSAATLLDRETFAQIVDFADANRVLAPLLAFELPYAAVRDAGVRENESIARLTDLGFRLSVDHVSDLRFDARELAEHKCRFMKIAASVLLDRNAQAAADIHPADMSGLLARNGIDLIAEKIESEETVVSLLDFDLKFGQGNLFSPPRPTRPDAKAGEEDEAAAVAPPAPAAKPAAAPAPAPAGIDRNSALARLARVVPRR